MSDGEAEIDASGRQIRGRSRKGAPTGSVGGKGSGSGSGPVPANMLVRKYGLPSTAVGSTSSDSWLHREEIPTSKEISGDGKRPGQDAVEIPVNTINAPWASKANYLRAHYELLREDAVAPLRDAVAAVKALPAMQDNDVVCIYEKVYLIGYTFSPLGPAARVVFSTVRAGKRILWDQSKRLIPGTLVALSPVQDQFAQKCTIAVVAARPLTGVHANPPEVDLFFATPDDMEIDPLQEWLMVEARAGYFEAYRHTLVGLQRVSSEQFPMSEHLVEMEKAIDAPEHIKKNPFVNFTKLYSAPAKGNPLANLNVLQLFPKSKNLGHDQSQLRALERILTKKLAIIQGPPGTGKTHVSVSALKLLLSRLGRADPPIIIASQTNHALDQMLRHISVFEKNFVRLGGRSLDQEVIKERRLHELRRGQKLPSISGGLRTPALKAMRLHEKRMTALLEPIHDLRQPISAEHFHRHGLLSEAQFRSLQNGVKEWVEEVEQDHPFGPVAAWLGEELEWVEDRQEEEDMKFVYEEIDPGFEQIQETEAEAMANDENTDSLTGTFRSISETFTGRRPAIVPLRFIERALELDNMWEIPTTLRGLVYIHLQESLKRILRDGFRTEAWSYMKAARELRVGKWEADCLILRNAKVIGMTTTGLSKYRPLVASLQPKILLVEEAAETLEALVTAGCVESLEHLILVGDHKQLRGHCAVRELEGTPYNLGISMFERLIANDMEFTTLTCQRRMAPEIRKNLTPIYGTLYDHECVLSPVPVPGMGTTRSFFFHHSWPESQDNQFSRCNETEAGMIVGLFNYLILNGMASEQITVLTFYNGQRKLIHRKLRSHPNLQGQFFNVKTVDGYQGEENAVVLLSLVRNNRRNDIGFLAVENRVCVALSRAKRGLYLFGNADMLSQASILWKKIVVIMSATPSRVGSELPIQCLKHGKKSRIRGPQEWNSMHGGCEKPCGGFLACGHRCVLKCHSFSHDLLQCMQACKRKLACGHKCPKSYCYEPCECECEKRAVNSSEVRQGEPPVQKSVQSWRDFAAKAKKVENNPPAPLPSSAQAWQEFAKNAGEPKRHPPLPVTMNGNTGRSSREISLLDIDIDEPFAPRDDSRALIDLDVNVDPPSISRIEKPSKDGDGLRIKRIDTIAWSTWIQQRSPQKDWTPIAEPSLLD